MAVKSITPGTEYDRLTVEGVGDMYITKNGDRLSTSVCVCVCGNRTTVLNSNLKRGDSRSCGCLDLESRQTRSITHGHCRMGGVTSEHSSWSGMLDRVTNQNNKRWDRYGGRGITVCDRWRKYENFILDMGEKPEPKCDYSIDRIDNDGDYCPENCRWATRIEQQNNTNSNRTFTFYGKTGTIREWSKITQVPHDLIRDRLKRGWPNRFAFWASRGATLASLKKRYHHHMPAGGPVR